MYTAAHVLCRPTSLLQRDSEGSRSTVSLRAYTTGWVSRVRANLVRRESRLGSAGGYWMRVTRGNRTTRVYTRLHTSTHVYTSARLQEHVSLIRLLFCCVHVVAILVGGRQSKINIL